MSTQNPIEIIKQRVEKAFDYYQDTVSEFLPRRSHNEGVKEHIVHSSIIHSFCNNEYLLYPEFPLPSKQGCPRSWGSLDLLIINKKANFAILCEWKRLYCSEQIGKSIKNQVERMDRMSPTELFKAIDSDVVSNEKCQRKKLLDDYKGLTIYCLWVFVKQDERTKEWFFGTNHECNEVLGKTPFATTEWEANELPSAKKSGINKAEEIPSWLYAIKRLPSVE